MASGPLELQLQVVLRHPSKMLENGLEFSVRETSSFNLERDLPLDPVIFILENVYLFKCIPNHLIL